MDSSNSDCRSMPAGPSPATINVHKTLVQAVAKGRARAAAERAGMAIAARSSSWGGYDWDSSNSDCRS